MRKLQLEDLNILEKTKTVAFKGKHPVRTKTVIEYKTLNSDI
jgi:hypothetical protein